MNPSPGALFQLPPEGRKDRRQPLEHGPAGPRFPPLQEGGEQLPGRLQAEIRAGKQISNETELYNFLENYSS